MRGTPWSVAFGEAGDCAVVQQLDPFDRPVDAVAVADGEPRETFVLFVPRGYLFPSLFLESLKFLVEVSDGLGVLLHISVMDSVPLLDGFNQRCGKLAKLDGIPDVETLYEVSCGYRGDGISVGDAEIGDGHKGCSGGARGSIRCHGDVGIGGTEWERVR